jgi:gas vesicle protein
MSESFDSDDPFADFTADDLDYLENVAIANQVLQQPSIQQQQPIPLPRTTSFQNAFPVVHEEPTIEDDYGQFNVDDVDLIVEDNATYETLPSPLPRPRLSRFPRNIDQIALMEELAHLRAETSRLKLERDKFETLAYSQDGKMDHLQRTLQKTKTEHESMIQRLQRSSEAEKQSLQKDLEDRERKLTALTADIEFQKMELREAREIANRGGIIRPMTNLNNNNSNNGDVGSPTRKAARVVKGSGVKSPEAKSRVGIFSARAFSKEESVGPAGRSNNNVNYNKKRKREEPRMITPEPVVVSEDLSEVEINRIVMERVLRERSSWSISDERFEVCSDKTGANDSLYAIFWRIESIMWRRFLHYRLCRLRLKNMQSHPY